jgi:hypothetical protein
MLRLCSICGLDVTNFDSYVVKVTRAVFECRATEQPSIVITFESPTMLGGKQPEGAWNSLSKKKQQQIWFWFRVPDNSCTWDDKASHQFIFECIHQSFAESNPVLEKWGNKISKQELERFLGKVTELLATNTS